jgi:hypothetical protein
MNEDNLPVGKLSEIKCEEKYFFLASLKSLKKRGGSIRQRYGYGSAPKCHKSLTLVFTFNKYKK